MLQEGEDLTIMAIGNMVIPSLGAAEQLQSEGFSVGVVNCRFAKPLDPRLAELATASGRVLVVEENIRHGGFGAAVMELFNDSGVDEVRVNRLGLPDRFIEHGPPDFLRKTCGLDVPGILKAAKTLLA